MKRYVLVAVLWVAAYSAHGDHSIGAPTPAGPITDPPITNSVYPFLLQQSAGQPGVPQPVTSMRYQQVYSASAFSPLDSGGEYITTIAFSMGAQQPSQPSWTIQNIQINLSTTQSSVGSLSPVFANNVGANDTIVFGAGQLVCFPLGRLEIVLAQPFLYNPAAGNLLLDVRVFDGTGAFDMFRPYTLAQNSPTDEVARVYATTVGASTAEVGDTGGLFTAFDTRSVPEPGSLVLFSLGIIVFYAFSRGRTRKN